MSYQKKDRHYLVKFIFVVLSLFFTLFCISGMPGLSASEGNSTYLLDALIDDEAIIETSGGGGGGVQSGSSQDYMAALEIVEIDRTRDIEAIVNAALMYPHKGFNNNYVTRFAVEPNFATTTPVESDIGTILPDDIEDALNTLRMIRFVAGVPYADVQFTSEYNLLSQHAAYYLAATNQITHEPDIYAGISLKFFEEVVKGCSGSNLSAGYTNLSASIIGQVIEPGANNIAIVGHRRWMLRPGGANFGIGHAQNFNITDSFYGTRSSLYVKNGPEASSYEPDTYIAWPAAGDFPIQYFLGIENISNYTPQLFEYPWSISLGSEYKLPSKDDLVVELKRSRGLSSTSWKFDKDTPALDEASIDLSGKHLAVDNGNYGMQKTIIFKPDSATLGRIEDGDIFSVSVTGLKGNTPGDMDQDVELKYEIRFFDLEKEMTRSTATFYVRNGSAPVSGAIITVGSEAVGVTDSNGMAKIRIDNNTTKNFIVTKNGYIPESGAISIGTAGITKTVDVYMPVEITLTDTNKTYTGMPQGIAASASPNVQLRITYNGSTDLPVDAGTYTVAAEVVAAGYYGTEQTEFTISPANLTVDAVNQTISYGDAIPTPNVIYTGLVGRDVIEGNVYALYNLGGPNAPGGRYSAGDYLNKIEVITDNYNVVILDNRLRINKKDVSVSGLLAFNKQYSEGDTKARLNILSAKLANVFDGDDVYLNYANVDANFEDDALGDNKRVFVSGLSLDGAQNDNYTLTNPALVLTANIKEILGARDVVSGFGTSLNATKDSRIVELPIPPEGFIVYVIDSYDTVFVSSDGIINPVDTETEVLIRIAARRENYFGSDDDDEDSDNFAVSNLITLKIPAFTKFDIGAFVKVIDSADGNFMPQGDDMAYVTGTGVYYINDTAVLRAVSVENGCMFIGWYDDGQPITGTGTTREYNFNVTSNRSIEARFIYYYFDFSSPNTGGGGGGSSGGGGGSATGISPVATPPISGTPAPTPAPTLAPTPKLKPTPAPNNALSQEPENDKDKGAEKNLANLLPAIVYPIMADIGPTHWAALQIKHLVWLGIVNGYPLGDGTYVYDPERLITRAEYMKLIAASLGLTLVDGFDGSRFADWIDVEDWAKPYIAALVQSGIVLGSSDNGRLYLNPQANVTREEMTVMAVRALDIQPGSSDEGHGFGAGIDVYLLGECIGDIFSTQDWAFDSVAFAIAEGLVNTRDSNGNPLAPTQVIEGLEDAQNEENAARDKSFFLPNLPGRRDEAAVLLSGLLVWIQSDQG